jgi:UDP-3-O-acyl-N-acetylglucosamine deacetylase
VDNCLVRVNAPEPPACDGSAAEFVKAIRDAGIISQPAPRLAYRVDETLIHIESEHTGIAVQTSPGNDYQIGFILDHGAGPIPYQSLNVVINSQNFVSELSDCRTFVRAVEVEQLRAQGLAQRATTRNAIVFGEHGVLDGTLRRPDECVRHKILDCVGDFALLGCDLIGRFTASRSGHRMNHAIVRQIRQAAASSPKPEEKSHLTAVSAIRHPPASPPFSHPRSPVRAGLGTSY